MRILYVEDDDNLAFAVEQMLRQDGHLCDRVRSGAGAVKLGQANGYDVILLDVMLPDIDGYEVIRLLQGAGIDTPVLIQSGLVERDKAMDGLGFGVDDYLIKPFNRNELISGVRKAATRPGNGSVPTADNLPALIASRDAGKTEPEGAAESVILLGDQSAAKKVTEPASGIAPELQAETAPEAVPEAVAERAPETPLEAAPDTTAESVTGPAAEPAVETETAEAVEEPPLPDSFPALPAKIIADEGRIDIDCIIISVTCGGAVLNVHDELIVCPDDFKLAVDGDKSYRCQSCWRHGDKVGVKFL